jgi:hypothetical protein
VQSLCRSKLLFPARAIMLLCSMPILCDFSIVLSIVYVYHLHMMLHSNKRTTIVLCSWAEGPSRDPNWGHLAFEIIGIRGCPRGVWKPPAWAPTRRSWPSL